MSGYRALAGYGTLKRNSGEKAWDLPTVSGSTNKASPVTIFNNLGTYLNEGEWQRFGAGLDFSVTLERNVNFHNDIGLRTYTVATTGIFEPDWTVNGYVSAKYLDWLKYAFNMSAEPTVSGSGLVTYEYKYTHPDGPKTFDIGYLQVNTTTNEYAGQDEFHILTGCAIDTVRISYELGSDAGVQFTIEGKALLDFVSLGTISGDINSYFESVPDDVFSTGCISTKVEGGAYEPIAQTDSVEFNISNFLERRGNCGTNWGSGYSMGTLNFEMSTNTYSNDPNKYELALYGYDSAQSIMAPTKIPYVIPYLKIRTDNSDSAAGLPATKALEIDITDTIASRLEKSYSSENAIMDSPTLRGKNAIISVTYMDADGQNKKIITYVLNGGEWDADAEGRVTTYGSTSETLPGESLISRENATFSGWYGNPDFTGTAITTVSTSTYPNGVTVYAKWTGNQNVTLNKNYSGSTASSITIALLATTISFTAPTRDNYTFGGYYAEQACLNQVISANGTLVDCSGYVQNGKWIKSAKKITLYAKWTATSS